MHWWTARACPISCARFFVRSPRFHFETGAVLDGPARPFLLAEFREISLRSARVWL